MKTLKLDAEEAEILEAVESGQFQSIATPELLAELQAAARYSIASSPLKYGLLRGELDVPDDFDAPLPPEVLASFEGR